MLPPRLSQREARRTVERDGERWNAATSSVRKYNFDSIQVDSFDGIFRFQVVNRVEFAPDTEIRLTRANCIRTCVEGEQVKLYYSTENSR